MAALEAENRALRAELEQSRRMLESATEYGTTALDPKGRITSWNGAPLREVIERALALYAGPPGRVATEGIPIRLASAIAVSLSLAFHELATNAAKYGALSVAEGGVAVTWTRRRAESGKPLLEVLWREHDGPPVQPPARQGFGSRLLARSLRHEFGRTVHHDFPPAGVECRICLPLTATVLGV